MLLFLRSKSYLLARNYRKTMSKSKIIGFSNGPKYEIFTTTLTYALGPSLSIGFFIKVKTQYPHYRLRVVFKIDGGTLKLSSDLSRLLSSSLQAEEKLSGTT